MARQFTWPSVTTLEVEESTDVRAPASAVRRKVGLYAARNNKRFRIDRWDGSEVCRVTRLPDPPLTSLMG